MLMVFVDKGHGRLSRRDLRYLHLLTSGTCGGLQGRSSTGRIAELLSTPSPTATTYVPDVQYLSSRKKKGNLYVHKSKQSRPKKLVFKKSKKKKNKKKGKIQGLSSALIPSLSKEGSRNHPS